MNPPAWSVVAPAVSDGLNGSGEDGHGLPPGPLVIAKLFSSSTSETSGALHGVKSAVDAYTPHAAGVASAAWAPPLNDSLKSVNGSSGVPSNVVVNWPVASSRCTFPTSLRFTPSAEAATSSFRFGGLDCRT